MAAPLLLAAAPLLGTALSTGVNIGSAAANARRLKKLKDEQDRLAAGPATVSQKQAADIASSEAAYSERVRQQLSRGAGITGVAGKMAPGAEAARQAAALAAQKFGTAKESARRSKEAARDRAAETSEKWIAARRQVGQAVAQGVADFAQMAPQAKAFGEQLRSKRAADLAATRTAATATGPAIADMKQQWDSPETRSRFTQASQSGIHGAGGWDDWAHVFER